jgi:hypothetical protein
MSDPSAPFSKLRERAKVKKEVLRQAIWHKTFDPVSDSMASGFPSGSMEPSYKASGSSMSSPIALSPKASCPTTPGSPTSAALAKICFYQSKWQIQD